MMLALWTAVTFLRPFSRAYSKAYCTIRSVPETLIGLIEMPVVAGVDLDRRRASSLMKSISSAVSGCAVLELDAGVEVLGVLADDHQVDRRSKKRRTPG